MAEPVGITGTAAGLVSLGLQLYGEISSYLAAYKGRQQDLDFAKLHCDNLKRCIDAINSAALPPTSDALTTSLESCQKELDALNDLVKGLQDPFSPATTLSDKLREKGKKLAYPFQREGLRELKDRLESTVPVLQLATQTLGLDVLLATHVDLGEVRFAMDHVRTITEDTRTSIDNISRSIECIGISTTESSKILPIIEERTATTSVLMAQQVEAVSQVGHQVSSHIDDTTRTVLGGIPHVGYRLDKFEEILVGIAEGMASQASIANIESGQLIGAANPATSQVMSDRLHALTDSMGRLPKHDFMLRNDIAKSVYESGNETPLCNCIEYRAQKHRRLQWGPVTVQAKWRANIRHSSKCPMGKFIKNQYQRSHGFELTIPALQLLTGKAINVFWSLSSGTGGIKLGRGLSVINTVSSADSTVFRLLEFAESQVINSWEIHTYLPIKDRWRLLGATWRRLLWCYVRGQGSPTDVDEKGETLLYSFLQRLGYMELEDEAEVGQQAVWLAHSLQLLQVPPRPNNHASSHPVALAIMGEWPTETSLYHQVMRKLVSHDTDTHGPFRPFIDDANASRRHFEILTSMPVTTAEVLNFPDLQIRILRQDERGVSQILKDNPSSVSEVNCYGQNSVHIAVGVGNLKVLQMILRYADALSLNAQDYAKGRGRYAVEYAAISQFHIGYRDTDNVECNCCDILDALLQADCALYPSFFLSIFFGCTRSEEGGTADCALRKVMLCLKERRQRLGEYAKKHLAPTQAVAFGIYGTSVLDEAAGDVQTALEERSISIPTSLRVYDSDSESWADRRFRSIHTYISDSATASCVWELGFRDLGVDSALGIYEISDSLLRSIGIRWGRSKVVSHLNWLLEKGLDLGKPLHCPVYGGTNFASWTASHLLSAFLARYNAWREDRREIGLHLRGEIAHAATSTSVFDICRCACALDGCSPLLMLLDGTTVWERQWYRQRLPLPTLSYYKDHFQWFCDFWAIAEESQPWANSSKPTPVLKLILRYLTFTALGLRHSCCRLAQSEGIQYWDSEEVDEVLEEQKEDILRLEELLEELKQDYEESPDLGTFVDGYWEPKVGTAIDELNARKLDEDDMKAARELGVTWHSFENEIEERDYSRSSDLDYWMEKLNTIVPEPDSDSDIPMAPDLPVRDP